MHEPSHPNHISRLLALAVLLAGTVSMFGCAGVAKKPVVVEERPSNTIEEKVAPAAGPSAAAAAVPAGVPEFWRNVAGLGAFHGYRNGIRWRLASDGIELENATITGHKVNPAVIRRVWHDYGAIIERWSERYHVPIEVILTTICVESKGNPRAKGGNNVGLMQLLPRTARTILNDPSVTEESLYDPNTNIRAGTAYIAWQSGSTRYDPPMVAAAYNAGRLRPADNRWGLKQYGPHLDKTVVWFNAVLDFVAGEDEVPRMSFAGYFKNRH